MRRAQNCQRFRGARCTGKEFPSGNFLAGRAARNAAEKNGAAGIADEGARGRKANIPGAVLHFDGAPEKGWSRAM